MRRTGRDNFWDLARRYLRQDSLCGFHDFVDDILLTHEQLLATVDQLMNDVTSSCVALYELPIEHAIDAMRKEAEIRQLEAVLRGVDVLLKDQCRSHMQSIVQSFLETNWNDNPDLFGLCWKKPAAKTLEDLNALTSSTFVPDERSRNQRGEGAASGGPLVPKVNSLTPVTLQHVAVRHWIFPRLVRKIAANFRQRYGRLLNKQLVEWDSFKCGTSSVDATPRPFPRLWKKPLGVKRTSPLYFLVKSGFNPFSVNESEFDEDSRASSRVDSSEASN